MRKTLLWIFSALCLLPLNRATFAQSGPSTLSLASGSTVPGGTVFLDLAFTSQPTSQPAGLEWTLNFVPSDIAALSVTTGPAAVAAGKTLSCAPGTGSYTCLLTGINSNTISGGVLATVGLTLSPTATLTTVGLTDALGASLAGTGLAVDATGGTVSVIQAIVLTSLACNPTSLVAPGTSTCTIALSAPAPAGGVTVQLSDNSAALSIPASAMVTAGAITATFTATSSAVASDQTAIITATSNGVSKTASLTLLSAPTLSSLACSPVILAASASSTCTVTLSKAAPATGAAVSLSSGNAAVTVPASVTVASGAASATFTATSTSVSSDQTVILTATYSGVSKTASLTVQAPPAALSSLACSPASFAGGAASTCTVTLSKAAPATGAAISLSSGNVAVTAPTSVTIASGAASATFTASSTSVSSDQTVVLTATYSGVSKTASLTVQAPTSSNSLTCAPTTLSSGGSGACTLTLAKPASSRGTTAYIYSSRRLLKAPFSVNISAGSRVSQFQITASTVTTNSQVTLTAYILSSWLSISTPIYLVPAARAKSSISHADPAALSLSCDPKVLQPGDAAVCSVRLGSGQPDQPAELAVSSGRGLKVPESVTIRSGQSGATFRASTDEASGQGSATITATIGSAVAEETLAVAPSPTPVLHVPAELTARFGASIRFTVSATDPADLPLSVTAAGLPAGASFDSSTGEFEWTPREDDKGTINVVFTATNSAKFSSTAKVRIEVSSGKPLATALVNTASRSADLACSPGALASVLGKWLVEDGSVFSDSAANATELGGTRVRINGSYAQLVYASPRQVSFLCPQLPPGSPIEVALETASGAADPLQTTMHDTTPGLFSSDGSGAGQGRVLLSGTSGTAAVRDFRNIGQPAQSGDRISILATGLQNLSIPHILVKVGGVVARIDSLGSSADDAGISEITVTLPGAVSYGDRIPLVLQVLEPNGNIIESNTVMIATEPAAR